MKKRPFHLSFPDQTILIDTSELPCRNGIPIFGATTNTEYLRKNHPEKVEEYLKHLENFEKKMQAIDNLLNKKHE